MAHGWNEGYFHMTQMRGVSGMTWGLSKLLMYHINLVHPQNVTFWDMGSKFLTQSWLPHPRISCRGFQHMFIPMYIACIACLTFYTYSHPLLFHRCLIADEVGVLAFFDACSFALNPFCLNLIITWRSNLSNWTHFESSWFKLAWFLCQNPQAILRINFVFQYIKII